MALSIQERLKDLRVERRLTLEQLAEQTGLSKSALGSYESDDYKDISHHAINKLADFYGVTTDYLLARTETKSHPNVNIADLCLSDDMIELLKNKRIDTALLCEMATHPYFVKLLADIQIYVEGIASMEIQNLNAWVDVARAEIMEKYQPAEHDKTAYLLQSAHVDEGDYFSSRVELKNDEFKHEDLGQLNAYVGYYKKNKMLPGDNPPVGILLCTDKGSQMVEYALSGMDNQLFVSTYMLHLPDKRKLEEFMLKELEEMGM